MTNTNWTTEVDVATSVTHHVSCPWRSSIRVRALSQIRLLAAFVPIYSRLGYSLPCLLFARITKRFLLRLRIPALGFEGEMWWLLTYLICRKVDRQGHAHVRPLGHSMRSDFPSTTVTWLVSLGEEYEDAAIMKSHLERAKRLLLSSS